MIHVTIDTVAEALFDSRASEAVRTAYARFAAEYDCRVERGMVPALRDRLENIRCALPLLDQAELDVLARGGETAGAVAADAVYAGAQMLRDYGNLIAWIMEELEEELEGELDCA